MIAQFISLVLMLLCGGLCSSLRPKFHKVNDRVFVVKINPGLITSPGFIRSQVSALNARGFVAGRVVVIATVIFGII